MNDFANDIKKDGTLDDATIGNDLENHLYYTDTTAVLNNFKIKYRKLYNADTVNSVDLRFIKNFQNNTAYAKDKDLIEFPEKDASSNIYQNILNSNVINGTRADRNAISCKINRKGIKLRIEILNEDNSDVSDGDVGIIGLENKLWLFKGRGSSAYWPDLNTNGIGTYTVPVDIRYSIYLSLTSKNFKINFYERDFITPTRSKIFTVR
jgi:hypothetical protein